MTQKDFYKQGLNDILNSKSKNVSELRKIALKAITQPIKDIADANPLSWMQYEGQKYEWYLYVNEVHIAGLVNEDMDGNKWTLTDYDTDFAPIFGHGTMPDFDSLGEGQKYCEMKFLLWLMDSSKLLAQSPDPATPSADSSQPEQKPLWKGKVLMCSWWLVDTNKLGEGVYMSDYPHLFAADYTKEKLIETHKDVQKYSGQSDEYISEVEKNLKKCRMEDIVIYSTTASQPEQALNWEKVSEDLVDILFNANGTGAGADDIVVYLRQLLSVAKVGQGEEAKGEEQDELWADVNDDHNVTEVYSDWLEKVKSKYTITRK